jgi:hypothetical protein
MKVNVVLEEKKIPGFEAKYGLDVYNDKGQNILSSSIEWEI